MAPLACNNGNTLHTYMYNSSNIYTQLQHHLQVEPGVFKHSGSNIYTQDSNVYTQAAHLDTMTAIIIIKHSYSHLHMITHTQ